MKIFNLLAILLLLSCKSRVVYLKQDITQLKQCFIEVKRPDFTQITELNLELVAKYIKELQGYIGDLELKTKGEQECVLNVIEANV